MAITTFPRFCIPPMNNISAGGLGITQFTMNALNDRVAFVILCPKSGTLDKFEFRTSTVSNNPDNGLRVSFQSVDLATGDPDGVVDQFRDIASPIAANTWQVPGLMTSDGTDGGVKRTVVAGELIACVVDFANFVASDSLGITVMNGGVPNRNQYVDDASVGVYSKNGSMPILALKYSDGTYAEFESSIWPVIAVDNATTGSGTTPDERALKFQLPGKMRCVGAYFAGDMDGPCDLVLYNAASGVIDTISLDPEVRWITSSNYFSGLFPLGPHTLDAATVYRLAVKPTSATTMTLQQLELAGATYQQCIPGGTNFLLSTRTDAGVWGDDSTRRPMIGLIFDGVDLSTDAPPGGGRAFAFVG